MKFEISQDPKAGVRYDRNGSREDTQDTGFILKYLFFDSDRHTENNSESCVLPSIYFLNSSFAK